jgi:hypothetical protein
MECKDFPKHIPSIISSEHQVLVMQGFLEAQRGSQVREKRETSAKP